MSAASEQPATKEEGGKSEVRQQLAGKDLQEPRYHRVKWRNLQKFTMKDDPDRCREPWKGPDFFREVDPKIRAEGTTARELPIRSRDQRMGGFARVVSGILMEDECAALLESINTKGFTPALLNTGGGNQQLVPEVRLGFRAIVDSPDFAAWLLEVLRPHLPGTLSTGQHLVDVNERCRFLCYSPGHCFVEHCDGRYTRSRPHPRAGDSSHITIQLYLHDVPEENGGATTFYPSSYENRLPYQPKAGTALLFTQNLPHEGSLLTAGTKYTMRTEVMYSPRVW